MTTEQKAKLRDELVQCIDISAWRWDNLEACEQWLNSILNYTLGLYASDNMTMEHLMQDRDTDTEDWQYESVTRWRLHPINNDSWMYGYKAGMEIINPKK